MANGKLAFSVLCMRCKHKAVLLPMSLAMRSGMAHPLERVYGQLVFSERRSPAEGIAALAIVTAMIDRPIDEQKIS